MFARQDLFSVLGKTFHCCNVCTHHGMLYCPSQPMITVPVVSLKDLRKSKWLEWDAKAVAATVVCCHPLLFYRPGRQRSCFPMKSASLFFKLDLFNNLIADVLTLLDIHANQHPAMEPGLLEQNWLKVFFMTIKNVNVRVWTHNNDIGIIRYYWFLAPFIQHCYFWVWFLFSVSFMWEISTN